MCRCRRSLLRHAYLLSYLPPPIGSLPSSQTGRHLALVGGFLRGCLRRTVHGTDCTTALYLQPYYPIIRISPYGLHVVHPALFETLYCNDGHWHKFSWAYNAFGTPSSTISCSDHGIHRARRRPIVPFFSKQHVAARQEILRRNIDRSCCHISNLAGTAFNLGAAISAFTRDSSNEFIVRKEYCDLGLDDFGIGLSTAASGARAFWRMTKRVPWFGPALKAMPIEWAMKIADDRMQSFPKYLHQSEQDARDTLVAVISPSPDPWVRDTLVHAIVHSNLPP